MTFGTRINILFLKLPSIVFSIEIVWCPFQMRQYRVDLGTRCVLSLRMTAHRIRTGPANKPALVNQEGGYVGSTSGEFVLPAVPQTLTLDSVFPLRRCFLFRPNVSFPSLVTFVLPSSSGAPCCWMRICAL